ncbi:MAG TPA: hypothetical protein VF170_12565, partial [Planctomycetaceae bacterium]
MSSVSQPTAPVGSLFSGSAAPPDEPRTFDYRPVPVSAPVAVFFGICSLLAFLHETGVPVALIGLFVSAWSLLKIRRSAGEYGGKWLAVTGLLLSAASLVGGTTFHSIAYATEVPEGHRRLNFTQDISWKGLVVENGRITAPPEVAALDGKKIFLKGYMFPMRLTEGLPAFVFCRDSGDCCFGGTPKTEDMIYVRMAEGQATDYYAGLVSVAGTFRL